MAQTTFERFQLRPLTETDAAELHSLIEVNRKRLARWLEWAVTQSFDDTLGFIREAEAQAADKDGCQRAVIVDSKIAGVVGFTDLDWENLSTGLGYWLASEHEGFGIMTGAVRTMVEQALKDWGLNRVEIRVAVENRRSRAIPERLGFRQEGTLHQAERVNGRFLDCVIYSMLATDEGPGSLDA